MEDVLPDQYHPLPSYRDYISNSSIKSYQTSYFSSYCSESLDSNAHVFNISLGSGMEPLGGPCEPSSDLNQFCDGPLKPRTSYRYPWLYPVITVAKLKGQGYKRSEIESVNIPSRISLVKNALGWPKLCGAEIIGWYWWYYCLPGSASELSLSSSMKIQRTSAPSVLCSQTRICLCPLSLRLVRTYHNLTFWS